MTVKSNVLTESFDGVTAPAIPSSISVDSNIVTDTAWKISGANSLASAQTSVKFWDTAGAVSSAGNQHVSFSWRKTGTVSRSLASILLEVTSTMRGGASGTCYRIDCGDIQQAGISLWKYVASTSATGISTDGGGHTTDFAKDITYVCDAWRWYDGNNDGWIALRIQRLSDNKYYIRTTYQPAGSAPSCIWDISNALALLVRDNSIAAAAAKAGGLFYNGVSSNTTALDDLSFDEEYPAQWHAYGDSITMNWMSTADPWPKQAGATLASTVVNHGINSRQCVDMTEEAYTYGSHASLIYAGTADMSTGSYGSDATKRGYFKSCLMAFIAKQCCKTLTKAQAATKGTVSGTTFSSGGGSWSNAALYDGATTCSSSTQNNGLQFASITGDIAYIGYTGYNASSGTFDVIVDGTTVSSGVACTKTGISSVLGQTRGPQLLRLTGLGAGSHTVVIKVTSSGTTVYIDWVAGIGNQSSQNKVGVGTIHYWTASGYTTNGYANEAAGQAVADNYNTDITAAVSTLSGDGLQAFLADVHSVFNTGTDLASDGIHLNASGSTRIGNVFAQAVTDAIALVGPLGGDSRLYGLGALVGGRLAA